MSSCDPRLAGALRSRHGHNQQNEYQHYTGNNYRDRSPIRDKGPQLSPRIQNSRRDVNEDSLSKNQEQYCDYRNMSVLPTVDELINRRDYVKLQANIVNGSYDNWSHYLCVQFFLLREDFISPLRQGICDYMRGNEEKSRLNIRIYKHIHILEPVCLFTGIGYQIDFDVTYLHHVDWEHSNRLIFGSLLCLSPDHFKTILFATVVNRDTKLLRKGIVEVQFENMKALEILKIDSQTEFIMVESTAYFEAYRHILDRLQHIEEDLPVLYETYILGHELPQESIPFPLYLSPQDLLGDYICFDLSTLGCMQSINVLDSEAWPKHNDLNLDRSQLVAVQMALTQKLSIIQGPPGTGKTYIGLKIVEVLLQNKAKWYPLLQSPILVVSYTNHALDQFLEGILNFTKEKDALNMVRIGGRCLSKDIQPYTLQQYKKGKGVHSSYELKLARRIMKMHSTAIYNSGLHNVAAKQTKENYIILTLKDLKSVIDFKHVKQFYAFMESYKITEEDELIEAWLVSLPQRHSNDHESDDVLMETETDLGCLNKHNYGMYSEAAVLENDRILEGEQIKFEHQDRPGKANDNHYTKKYVQKIRKGLKCKPMSKQEVLNVNDITCLNWTKRWSLYHYWVSQYLQVCKLKTASCIQSYTDACEQYQKARIELDYRVLCDAHIIGMTTTGAAKYHSILQKLRPKIIIIEEAAEVLESHVVTTLTASTQQVIMIGDHQQLRPKPNDYYLATKYNLEVSLFERLIKNKFPYTTLEVQHRMRPEIAQLICPHIYPHLFNAPNVLEYDNVEGVKSNMFFLDHSVVEDDDTGASTSHFNNFEALFVVELCSYFIKLGYDNSRITVLTTYASQFRRIAKIMQSKFRVRISTVDNFQGEENDIVILSLVRSNEEGRVGFLKEPNRVCVALSRAKIGFFVIGNFSMLKRKGGKEWLGILGDMDKKQLIGTAMPLYCPLHDITTFVSSIEDFKQVPNGGCSEMCGFTLQCGHLCHNVCHPGSMITEHASYTCMEECNKMLDCSHQCTRKCFECKNGCGPCQTVIFVDFSCGHTNLAVCSSYQNSFQCHQLCNKLLSCGHNCKNLCYQPCTAKCEELVIKQFPCGHSTKVKIHCYKPISSIQCNEPCKEVLSCGHLCSGDCHSCFRGRLHKLCQHLCSRTLPCGHDYQIHCYKSNYEQPSCSESCNNFCNHGKSCTNKCGEPCTSCVEECQWKCKHHKCGKKCYEICDRPRCNKPCTKLLKCLHPCIGLCREKCPQLCRECDAAQIRECFLGGKNKPDAQFIQLEDCEHIFEVSGFDHYMDQQDSTDCKPVKIQFKFCPKCKVTICRSLRYSNVIKQILYDMEMIKNQIRQRNNYVEDATVEVVREAVYQCKLLQCSKPWWKFSRQFLNIIESRIQDTDLGTHTLQCKLTLYEIDTIHFQIKNLPKLLKLFGYTPRYTYNLNSHFSETEVCIQDIEKQLVDLCKFLTREHSSTQNKIDIIHEFNRLLVLLYSCQLYHTICTSKSIDEPAADLKDLIIQLANGGCDPKHKISTDHTSAICFRLNEIAIRHGIDCIFKPEVIDVMNETGITNGVWFKCHKGHYFYASTANELSECPKCTYVHKYENITASTATI